MPKCAARCHSERLHFLFVRLHGAAAMAELRGVEKQSNRSVSQCTTASVDGPHLSSPCRVYRLTRLGRSSDGDEGLGFKAQAHVYVRAARASQQRPTNASLPRIALTAKRCS